MPADRVADVMARVDRRGFLRPAEQAQAARDAPLPIGEGATSSQPTTVAAMLRLLDVQPGDRVLDVGAGSGWTTALLGELTGADGVVVGTELVPALVEFGSSNVRFFGTPRATIHQADRDVLGWPREAPYHRILVSAMADDIPVDLIAQLAPGGTMVLPAHGTMLRVRRPAGDGDLQVTEHGAYRFVPLVCR